MDGGRVLRALIAFGGDYLQATRIAAGIGQTIALLFGLAGLLLPNPLLIFIALFVWIGAAQEGGAAAIRATLGGVPVSRVMVRNFRSVGSADALSRVVEALLDGFQQDFPVIDDGRLIGMINRADLVTTLKNRGDQILVAEVLRSEFPKIQPNEPVEAAMRTMAEVGLKNLPVVHDGTVVGMLTSENLGEYLMVRDALRGWRSTSPSV